VSIHQVQGDDTAERDISSGWRGCLEKELQSEDGTLPQRWASAKMRQWDEGT